jgi:DNA-binding MurR/RpiR family transcriptional regulator
MPQPGQTLAEELVDITPGCGGGGRFSPSSTGHPPGTAALHKQGVPTVAISEPQAAGITTLARWHFGLPLDSVSAFDSYSSAMSLVNLLANALLHSALTEGRQRIHNIASLYTELDELEQR